MNKNKNQRKSQNFLFYSKKREFGLKNIYIFNYFCDEPIFHKNFTQNLQMLNKIISKDKKKKKNSEVSCLAKTPKNQLPFSAAIFFQSSLSLSL